MLDAATGRRRPLPFLAAGLALVAVTVAGCASADEGGTAAPPTSTASSGEAGPSTASGTATGSPSVVSPSSAAVTVTVSGGKATVEPAELQVAPREPVVLQVTSDRDNELHVHGVDLEQELEAGVPTTLNLSFPDPGVYEVELHDPELHLLDVTVGSVGG